jgi:hypothetical protein
MLKDRKPLRNRGGCTFGRGAGSACSYSVGSPSAVSSSHLSAHFLGEMLVAAGGITE